MRLRPVVASSLFESRKVKALSRRGGMVAVERSSYDVYLYEYEWAKRP